VWAAAHSRSLDRANARPLPQALYLLKAMRTHILILITILLFSAATSAEITSAPAAKENGDLAIVIVASDSPGYIEEWIRTPSEHGVTIKRLKSARPNQLIVTSFLVTGLSPDKDGNFRFNVSFKLIDPSNNIVIEDSAYARGSGKLPSKPTFIMADPALDLFLEPSDPAGKWSVVATAKDLVNGKSAVGSYTIKLVK
jgi:hypothetical protein